MVVDDSKVFRVMLKDQLETVGYKSMVLDSGDAALEVLKKDRFDVVITDQNMPGKTDGIGLLEIIKQNYPETDVIVLTGYASEENSSKALSKGATDYLTKPYRFNQLLACLEQIEQKKK